ncbi:MAG: Asp-tRNA(Asn)/Glu-tRNA(Gln) amidotransferase subunit GatC [Neisseriales bacterium]|nr:MAG: Asp-tRNA(Asn)/Glu-tRNA(Gln) amidotransferase subunit GatC [Neisseriales bacterium]
MLLTEQEIKHIAKLARIAMDDTTSGELHDHLNRIFSLIETMQSVNTDHIEPMAYAHHVALRLRKDVAMPPCPRNQFLSLAPQAKDGLFLVPKVIE